MFTGIITAVGAVAAADGARRRFSCPPGWLADAAVGDSIAVNGACLTVTEIKGDGFCADISAETRRRCAPLAAGAGVNLEQALAVGGKLGGHFVTGHVDGVAEIAAVRDNGGGVDISVRPPQNLMPLLAEKGSLALAGVSLTVAEVAAGEIRVCLVPHTIRHTIFSAAAAGMKVNIEADILARHIARLREFAGDNR